MTLAIKIITPPTTSGGSLEPGWSSLLFYDVHVSRSHGGQHSLGAAGFRNSISEVAAAILEVVVIMMMLHSNEHCVFIYGRTFLNFTFLDRGHKCIGRHEIDFYFSHFVTIKMYSII